MKTIIPAAPGFFRLSPDDDAFFESSIVAWVVDDEFGDGTWQAVPVCVDWNFNHEHEGMNKPLAIRRPDGSIEVVEGRNFPKGKDAEALAHVRELKAEHAAQRKEFEAYRDKLERERRRG